MMELLQYCSDKMSGGKKLYQSLYTFDGNNIASLDLIPQECKIILVSEKEPSKADGLKNNIFDYKSELAVVT